MQNTSATIHSTITEAQVLGASANQAGYATGTSTYNSIVNSTGDLRKSWLMRNHAVGITLEETTVTYECVTNSYGWCYGTAWPTTARYAPNRTEALESMRELKAIMDGAERPSGHCTACFSGRYPISIPEWLFEEDRQRRESVVYGQGIWADS